ncbi:MAG TPA: RNA polymerase sigma factor [Candidatus Binatia bacterium]|nr:RNA polymerase sigma factor [Candidatus Binatia bacterium]
MASGRAHPAQPALPDERALIESAQRDPRRFADLYEHNFERVYAYVIRRVGDRDLAQDLTADVFHQALANLGRFEWRGVPFAAWLFRIAANAVVDRAQRSARERTLAPATDPEEVSAEDIEERARLFRLVNELPDDQRRVIVMRFAEQRSIRDVAAAMRRSEGAVKQLQFRALERLRGRVGMSNG